MEQISDLSTLISDQVHQDAIDLQQTWHDNWAAMADDRGAADKLIAAIDRTREAVKGAIASLK